jgi:TonB family protein
VARAKVELASGKSFDAVWAAYADPITAAGTKDGDLGYFKRGVMLPQIETQAFCLPIGAVSPVVRTVFGYHLVQVTEVRPPPTYAEIVARAIKANIMVKRLPVDNPAAEVFVRVATSGAVINAKLIRSSGNVDWDEAVVSAVYRTAKLPLDADGRIPGEMYLVFRPH